MVRELALIGFAAVLIVKPLRGQETAAIEPPSTTQMTEKDRAASDDQNGSNKRLMGMIVRLVPSSRVAWRSSALGKQVQAEGVAFAGRVIIDGGDIKVKGDRFDLFSDAYHGRLVKVTGTLRYSRGATSRFGDQPPYFYIDPDRCQVVERVGWPSITIEDETGVPPISIAKPSSKEK